MTPSILGMEKPQMSPSTMPTRCPPRRNETARFELTDDLPTPPLPEEIASTLVGEPGSPSPGPDSARNLPIQSIAICSVMTSTVTSAPRP